MSVDEKLANDEAEAAEIEAEEAVTAEIEAGEPEPDIALDKLALRSPELSAGGVGTILEGLLFVAALPLPLDQVEKVTGIAPEVADAQFRALQQRYAQAGSGLVLHEVAGGWQLRTAPECSEYVRRLLQIKPQRLTRAALETLAIIAYRQPVTRPEIEDIRSVDSGAVVKALLERKLIKILGKKEEPGHPLLYGTSKEFLEFFNLKNLASLPTLREFQELSEESRQIVEEQIGEKPEPIAGHRRRAQGSRVRGAAGRGEQGGVGEGARRPRRSDDAGRGQGPRDRRDVTSTRSGARAGSPRSQAR